MAAALILGVMGALMIQPIREESATADEPVFLGAGYSYWMGHRYYLNCEHPPLMQLWSAAPLLFLPIETAPKTSFYFDQSHPLNMAPSWDYYGQPFAALFPRGFNFYYYPLFESRNFGDWLVYGNSSNADRVLFWGRLMQVLVTLAVGGLMFWWAKALSNVTGGLLALISWAFNPVALAYGHLVLTDPGIALFLPLAVWMFSRFLERPGPPRAAAAGVALAAALLTKFSAILLVPIGACLVLLAWWLRRQDRELRSWWVNVAKGVLLLCVIAWGLVLLAYFPAWSPPPHISSAEAAAIKVPGWFRSLRWVLIPAEYFKGLGIVMTHSARGHPAYLMGAWSDQGWWYYFPAVILLKTPLSLVLLVGLALVFGARRCLRMNIFEWAPLAAAVVYLECSTGTNINIGVRHVLPVYPLLGVTAGVWLAGAGPRLRLLAYGLGAWLVLTAILAHPCYIQYFSELAGGSANGYKCLVDSNLDWGQDGKRIKSFMTQNRIEHVYLECTVSAIARSHLNINYTEVDGAAARRLTNACLMVSASFLVKPEWDWLRERQSPTARLGNSTFVYQLP